MMSFASPSHSKELASIVTVESTQYPGVTFTIRRMTLRQRITLLRDLHALYREQEFSTSGSSHADKINAQISSLRIEEVFLRWGVVDLQGLVVDGKAVEIDEVSERAPEGLVSEILAQIRECVNLTVDEVKN